MIVMMTTVIAEESVQKTLKNRRRKRKSYSSAAEMLSFLQSYTEKKEKAEEEKIKLLREMQQKKMSFSVNLWMSWKRSKPYVMETESRIFLLIFIIDETVLVCVIVCCAPCLFGAGLVV